MFVISGTELIIHAKSIVAAQVLFAAQATVHLIQAWHLRSLTLVVVILC